jgi:hypothetical protein
MSEFGLARRNIVIILGIVCIVLAVGLVGVSVFFTSIIGDENNKISALDSQISQLESNVTSLQNQISSDNSTINSMKANITHLQDQLGGFLTPTFGVGIIAGAAENWENRTVVVEGKLTGPMADFITFPWHYAVSTSGTFLPQTALGTNRIGVDLGARGRYYMMEDVFVIGVVRKGIIETIVVGEQPMVSYYIEAWFVVPH